MKEAVKRVGAMITGAATISNWISRELSVYKNRGGATKSQLNSAASQIHTLAMRRLELENSGKISSFFLDRGLHDADVDLYRSWGMLMQRFDPDLPELKSCYPCLEKNCKFGKDCKLNQKVE